MNAKEMFEKLGYSLEVDNDYLIEYSKEDCGHIYFYFLIKTKRFYSSYCLSLSFKPMTHSITLDEFEAVQKQMEELGWLEEEKQEIKQETNFEHYKDEILECCIDNLAVVKGIPKSCSKIDCNDCDFLTIQKECCEIAKDWLKQSYKKQSYKLSKFEFDIIQTYSDCHESCKFSDFKQLIELKDKGYFKCVDYDTNIKDILANCEVSER